RLRAALAHHQRRPQPHFVGLQPGKLRLRRQVPVYGHAARGWLVEVCPGPARGSVPGRGAGLALVERKLYAAADGRVGPEAAPEL
nr:hypothetical protein [Tanacetum cinerariifolium]